MSWLRFYAGQSGLINLTPHPVCIVSDQGERIREIPSEGLARLEAETVREGEIDGIPISRTKYGKVTGLPDPQEGTHFIVSQMVKDAAPDRQDLLTPAELKRDDQGNVVGARSLGR